MPHVWCYLDMVSSINVRDIMTLQLNMMYLLTMWVPQSHMYTQIDVLTNLSNLYIVKGNVASKIKC